MKKMIVIIIVIILIISGLCINDIVIPEESIRFRIIANSNNEQDQMIKKEIVKQVSQDIIKISSSSADINDVRQNINKGLPQLKSTIDQTLIENNISSDYEISYGMNYFPEKRYDGHTYPAGNYESVVIKLGRGAGDNFWCVLFPPLCLLEVEDKEEDKVEYTSFIKEIIDKYF